MLRFVLLFLFFSTAYAACGDDSGDFPAPDENGHVTIPEGVTAIPGSKYYDYYGNCNVKSITFPSTLTEIGSNAFRKTNLESLTFPDGLVTISTYTFAQVDTLPDEVIIPASVTSIGNLAFGGNYFGDQGTWNGNLTITRISLSPPFATTIGTAGYQYYKLRACPTWYDLDEDDISDDSLCLSGCTDSNYAEYDATAVVHDNAACVTLTNLVTIDDFSCGELKTEFNQESRNCDCI
tara:strand:- start:834 stop:1541 length:708 start_codon:yes stop_codon:yes gene_type:complete